MNKKGLVIGSALSDFFFMFFFVVFAVIMFGFFESTTLYAKDIHGAIQDSSESILLLNYLRTPVENLVFADMIGLNINGEYDDIFKTETKDFLNKHAYGLGEDIGQANLQVVYFDMALKTQRGAPIVVGEGCEEPTAGTRVPTIDKNVVAVVSLLRCYR